MLVLTLATIVVGVGVGVAIRDDDISTTACRSDSATTGIRFQT